MPSCTTCKFCKDPGKLTVSCDGLSIPSQEAQTQYSVDINIGSIFNATMLYDLANPYEVVDVTTGLLGAYRTIFISPNYYTFCAPYIHPTYGVVNGMQDFSPFNGGEYVEYTDVGADITGCTHPFGGTHHVAAFYPVDPIGYDIDARALFAEVVFYPDTSYNIVSSFDKNCNPYNTRYFLLSITVFIAGIDMLGNFTMVQLADTYINAIGIHEGFNTLNLYKIVTRKPNPSRIGTGMLSVSQTALYAETSQSTMVLTAL